MDVKVKMMAAAAVLAVAALAVGAAPAAAGEWTCRNPAGNEVQGECSGEALVVVNPGGGIPPGHNK
jgi:hypothetical protein